MQARQSGKINCHFLTGLESYVAWAGLSPQWLDQQHSPSYLETEIPAGNRTGSSGKQTERRHSLERVTSALWARMGTERLLEGCGPRVWQYLKKSHQPHLTLLFRKCTCWNGFDWSVSLGPTEIHQKMSAWGSSTSPVSSFQLKTPSKF